MNKGIIEGSITYTSDLNCMNNVFVELGYFVPWAKCSERCYVPWIVELLIRDEEQEMV